MESRSQIGESKRASPGADGDAAHLGDLFQPDNRPLPVRRQPARTFSSQTAPIAIAAAGATFVILCAEIDLSIGTLSVFVGVLAAWFWVGTWKDLGYWSIPVALLVGAAIGYFNGFCVAWIGIPSFMMTLAMLTIAQGLAIYTSLGQPIFDIPDVLKYIGGYREHRRSASQ